jgi:biopolymer transport protein ExbD
MIDVVFLLLVFFMLAARFGQDMALPLTVPASGDVAWQGPPRLIEVRADAVLLNGTALGPEQLGDALAPLMPTRDAPVLIRGTTDADVARLVDIIDLLRAAGLKTLIVVE